MTPHYEAPTHLSRLTEKIELALAGIPQKVVCHAPPRHGKTETVLHSISYGLARDPRTTFGYASYNTDIALSKSRIARDLAVDKAHLVLSRNTLREWRTFQGGGCMATGIGGGLTGYGLNVAFVDDSVKDRVEAESPRRRERVHDWFRDVLMTRIEPRGSVFVFQTRWHTDDLPGRLIKEGWEYICLPALVNDGERERPLWEARWSLDELQARRKDVGPYSWESLYQGSPRPRGGTVFGPSTGYQKLPRIHRVAIGVDLAYAAKSSSDWSTIVVMMEASLPESPGAKFYFIADTVHVQVRPPQFLEICRLYKQRYAGARWRWYASGTEQGAASFMTTGANPINLEVLTPRGDKFTRSIPYAAAWNARKVLVPGGSVWNEGEAVQDAQLPPEWLEKFLGEHADFTGVDDKHDDIVDAAVAAYDIFNHGSAAFPATKEKGPQRRSF